MTPGGAWKMLKLPGLIGSLRPREGEGVLLGHVSAGVGRDLISVTGAQAPSSALPCGAGAETQKRACILDAQGREGAEAWAGCCRGCWWLELR